jgi:hypothetical protein
MISNLAHLFSAPTSALFLGACLIVALLTAAMAFGSYYFLRQQSLLYFGIVNPLAFLLLSAANEDPQMIHDVGGDWLLLRGLHGLVAIALFAYYRLILNSFSPPSKTALQIVTGLAILSRVIALITLNETMIQLSALMSAFFLLVTFLHALTFKPNMFSDRLMQIAACTFTGLIAYPLVRSGVFPPVEVKSFMPFLVLAVLALCSMVWLFAVMEMAHETIEKTELGSLKKMAREFIYLRDLMNTPLQVMEFSTAILHRNDSNRQLALDQIANALKQMRLVSATLSRFDRKTGLAQADDFTQLQSNKP